MNEWIKSIVEIAAAVGTLWAANSARQSAQTSAKQLNSQIKEQEKIERPRLFPLNKELSSEVPLPLADWVKDENNKIKLLIGKSKFSDFTLPIINTGKSFAIDVRYSYEIEGGIHAIDDKDYDNHAIIGPSSEEKLQDAEFFSFTVKAIDSRYSPERVNWLIADVVPYFRYIPIVQSNEIKQIQIPSYFVALSNIYLINCWYHNDSDLIRPKLILTIYYKDQYNNEHIDYFRMQLSNRQMSFKGSIVEAWIDFEQIEYNEK